LLAPDPEEGQKVIDLLQEYRDVFAWSYQVQHQPEHGHSRPLDRLGATQSKISSI